MKIDEDENINEITLMDIERSIIKKYRKELWVPFVKAISEFNLIEKNDKIAICISGGKDSLLLAKLMQEIQKHGKVEFELEFLSMNPGYSEEDSNTVATTCKKLGIPVKFFKSDVFAVSDKLNTENPCYLCARMRRGFLYSKAQELGCNKIALGHHMDDVIETTLLNLCYSGSYKTMLPKLKSLNFENMELIRPLFYIREESIIKFTKYSTMDVIRCGCTVTKKVSGSKRKEMKNLVTYMKTLNSDIDKSIMRSAFNVNLDGILGFKSRSEKYTYLDFYDDKTIISKHNDNK